MSIINSQSFYEQLENEYKQMLAGDRDRDSAQRVLGGEEISAADKMVRKSFLYQYLKEIKDADVKRVSRDKKLLDSEKDRYTLLNGAYIASENKVISKKKYRSLFFKLNNGIKKREELFDTDPKAALDLLSDRLLKDYIDDFLHNAKSRLKRSKNNSANGTRVDEIEMLYKFDKHITAETFESSSELSEEFIAKCEALYKIIRADKKQTMWFVPLYIDKDSGAGVYIVGRGIFNSEDVTEAKPCVLMFDAVNEADEPFMPIEMVYTIYSSIREAFEELKKGVETGRCFIRYSEYNGSRLPKSADKCFKSRFFYSRSVDAAMSSKKEEIKRQYNQQEAEGIKKMNEEN